MSSPPSHSPPPSQKSPKRRFGQERTTHDLTAITSVVSPVTRPLLKRRGLDHGDLLAHWPAIVGQTLSRLCQPEALHLLRNEQGYELVLRVGSGAAATHIQHLTPLILEKINTFCGKPPTTRIKLLQAPLPPRKTAQAPQLRPLTTTEKASLEELLSEISDPLLRDAFARLGTAMLGRR